MYRDYSNRSYDYRCYPQSHYPPAPPPRDPRCLVHIEMDTPEQAEDVRQYAEFMRDREKPKPATREDFNDLKESVIAAFKDALQKLPYICTDDTGSKKESLQKT